MHAQCLNHVLMQQLVFQIIHYHMDTIVIVKQVIQVMIVNMIVDHVRRLHVGKIFVNFNFEILWIRLGIMELV